MERAERSTGVFARSTGLAVDATPRVRSLWLAPLALRFSLAAVFFAHGAQKLLGTFGGAGISGTIAGFAALGLKPPALFAMGAAVLEFFGGLLLLIGFWTRPAALLLALEMLFALLTVHAPNGFFLNWACTAGQGHGIEYNVVLIGGLVALALLGGGRISIDGSRAMRHRSSAGLRS
jgi:putative oxidoreductase